MCTAFLAGDLFNLYVGFEVLLSASFVLLTIGASTERVRAGISYVMVSMVSSLIFLIGLALIYAATGTLNMAELAVRLDDVSGGTRSALFAVLLVAFGIKAAVFPLSTWLPDSYPTAPAPGHRGVRRPADQSRCVRDHPGALAAVPRRRRWTRCCWWRRC